MATVIEDTIEASSISVSRDGYSIIRTFKIYGVTGVANIRQYNAIKDAGLPAIGSTHPATGLTAYTAVRKSCAPVDQSNGIFAITVEYALINESLVPDDTAAPVESVGASVSEQATNIDINGDPLVVTYDGKPQTGTINVMKPNFVLGFDRLETGSPVALAAAYVGFVNSDTFKGFPANTLLCTRIEGSGNDTTGWNVHYEFQYNAQFWLSTVVYQDENGIVPSDVTVGDGIEVFDVYDSVAFSGLNL